LDSRDPSPPWAPDADPDDTAFRDLLRRALGEDAPTRGDDADLDQLLAGVAGTDEERIARAIGDPDLREVLADVGSALVDASGDRASLGLKPTVRAAVLAAVAASLELPARAAADGLPAPGVSAAPSIARARAASPLRVVRPAIRRASWAVVSVAAALLVAVGLAIVLSRRPAEAAPGLQLAALDRLALPGGALEMHPGRVALVGEVFEPALGELLALRFEGDAKVVLGAGDAVRVAEGEPDEHVDAVLRLENGEARLETSRGPVSLAVRDAGTLVLRRGAAHVTVLAGAVAANGPAVALAARSTATWRRADGATFELAGPTTVLLGPDGPTASGEPAGSLFRDLEFFGGTLGPAAPEVPVGARHWRIASGDAQRSRGRLRLDAPVGAAGGEGARLAWAARGPAAGMRVLELAVRGPAGLRVLAPDLGVEATLDHDTRTGSEPGVPTVDLALPVDWAKGLPDGELTLVFSWPPADASATGGPSAASRGAWFDAAVFSPGDARPLDAAASGAGAADGPR
jgi:hypothetical protein